MLKELEVVKKHWDVGDNIIPLRTDGSKAPLIKWAGLKLNRLPWYKLKTYYENPNRRSGIGLLAGFNNHWMLDFDYEAETIFPEFWKQLPRHIQDKATIVRTPKPGFHCHFKSKIIPIQRELASSEDDKVLIEIISRQPMVMSGTPNITHKSGKPYKLVKGDQFNVNYIDDNDIEFLKDLSYSFDRSIPDETICAPFIARQTSYSDSPGDIFNSTTPWEAILEPMGWRRVNNDGWIRPDKTEGISATTNWNDKNYFYCFSTSTKFEAYKPYNKFAVYTTLYHNGDFERAGKELYNKQRQDYNNKLLEVFNDE